MVLVVCVFGISARPQQSTQQKEPVQIVSLENEASVDGSYHYRYVSETEMPGKGG